MMTAKLLIAGGGTGGHIFPGIAIAEEWRRRGGDVIFVGTKRGQEGVLIPKNGFALKFLNVGSLKGAGWWHQFKTMAGLPVALWQARRLLQTEKPNVVLGIGGYASGPLCLAACLLGKKTAITDQNSHPGMTNRILGRFVKRVFLSFGPSADFFPKKKIVMTGNPVRAQIVPVPYELPHGVLRIFVFGGSQGAVSVNTAFLAALDLMKPWWSKIQVTHQAGRTDLNEIKSFYEARGIVADVGSFFDNMSDLYARAHVVICRSGAGTLTELALSGRPAILIPYPFAADNHQVKNAELFVANGAAWMIEQKDLSGARLQEMLCEFFKTPQELAEKAKAMRAMAKPDAAKIIVDELLHLGTSRSALPRGSVGRKSREESGHV